MSKKESPKSNFDSIDKLIENTFNRLKDIVDANTIIGSTIQLTDSMYIIPISKVSVGLISGGGEFPDKRKNTSINACSTSGFNITPMGFVTVNNTTIDFLATNVVETGSNKLLEALISMLEKYINKEDKNEN